MNNVSILEDSAHISISHIRVVFLKENCCYVILVTQNSIRKQLKTIKLRLYLGEEKEEKESWNPDFYALSNLQ